MTGQPKIVWVIGIGLVMLAAAAAHGEEADHLLGYKVTDADKFQPPPVSHRLTPTGLPINDCVLKKAKFVLVQSVKDGGDDPRGGPAGHFVCYRAKCAKSLPVNDPELDDVFGGHPLHLIKTQLVCLPSEIHICGDNVVDPGEICDGTAADACPGQCQSDCTCPSLPDCQATTGGFCWFLGNLGESCTTVCANHSLVYDPATSTYAGELGTDANCTSVLNALGATGSLAPGEATSCPPLSSYPIDCAYCHECNPDQQVRAQNTACGSGPDTWLANFERACACR